MRPMYIRRLIMLIVLVALEGCNKMQTAQAPTRPPPAPPSVPGRYQVLVLSTTVGMQAGLDRWVRLDTQTGDMLFCSANAYLKDASSTCRHIDASVPVERADDLPH